LHAEYKSTSEKEGFIYGYPNDKADTYSNLKFLYGMSGNF
jgi:hypothetical protein